MKQLVNFFFNILVFKLNRFFYWSTKSYGFLYVQIMREEQIIYENHKYWEMKTCTLYSKDNIFNSFQ